MQQPTPTVRERVCQLFQSTAAWNASSGMRCRYIVDFLIPIIAADAELVTFINEYGNYYKYDRRRTPLYRSGEWPDRKVRTENDGSPDVCKQLTEFEDDIAMILTLHNKYYGLLE